MNGTADEPRHGEEGVMLTKEQIEAARVDLEYAVRDIGDDEPELAQEKANARTCLKALDAYERVAALLVQWSIGSDTCAWRDSMGTLVAELRRALEGGK